MEEAGASRGRDLANRVRQDPLLPRRKEALAVVHPNAPLAANSTQGLTLASKSRINSGVVERRNSDRSLRPAETLPSRSR